jgi:hypothetical protein
LLRILPSRNALFRHVTKQEHQRPRENGVWGTP